MDWLLRYEPVTHWGLISCGSSVADRGKALQYLGSKCLRVDKCQTGSFITTGYVTLLPRTQRFLDTFHISSNVDVDRYMYHLASAAGDI